jgi:hypothetical protein
MAAGSAYRSATGPSAGLVRRRASHFRVGHRLQDSVAKPLPKMRDGTALAVSPHADLMRNRANFGRAVRARWLLDLPSRSARIPGLPTARLLPRGPLATGVTRQRLGVPTVGEWRWRTCAGFGEEAVAFRDLPGHLGPIASAGGTGPGRSGPRPTTSSPS